MNLAVTGASGFIGQRLIARLLRQGHSVHALGRRRPSGFPDISFSEWNVTGGSVAAKAISTADAMVHLAGEPVGQRWNADVKQRIRDSRVKGTRALVEAVATCEDRPDTLVCASAIGYYGDRADEILEED